MTAAYEASVWHFWKCAYTARHGKRFATRIDAETELVTAAVVTPYPKLREAIFRHLETLDSYVPGVMR